uniref:Uncharacterized protein n=1 Tax=Arundo donax TaxID=35708 RepID=A0A0A8YIH8_ARUDO
MYCSSRNPHHELALLMCFYNIE